MPEHGDEQAVWILRVDVDVGDHLAVEEAEMRPGRAGIGRLVEAVAGREVRPNDSSTRPDVNDVRIRRRDGDRADRAGRLTVEERLPGRAVVRRAPHAAVIETDVCDVG